MFLVTLSASVATRAALNRVITAQTIEAKVLASCKTMSLFRGPLLEVATLINRMIAIADRTSLCLSLSEVEGLRVRPFFRPWLTSLIVR